MAADGGRDQDLGREGGAARGTCGAAARAARGGSRVARPLAVRDGSPYRPAIAHRQRGSGPQEPAPARRAGSGASALREGAREHRGLRRPRADRVGTCADPERRGAWRIGDLAGPAGHRPREPGDLDHDVDEPRLCGTSARLEADTPRGDGSPTRSSAHRFCRRPCRPTLRSVASCESTTVAIRSSGP